MNTSTSIHQESATTKLAERAGLYFFFARLFREAPTAELLREIVQHRWLSNAEEDPQWPNQAEAIAVEYARLFAVPGEQAVRPYESAYCDTLTIDSSTACSAYFESEPQIGGLAGFLYGPSASAVRAAYLLAGFELDSSAHELPDHLAIELEFMGRLLEHGELERAGTFFAEHLGRWVFRCLEEIRQKTPSRFYRAVVDSLETLLQDEQALLARV
ncbi:MAG: molecular chaperone TorD family protein [Armatimonadetes bacterium]|nr:molecular chaperone TorD family protein [Armatimonadota bacterium]